jgi:hypothetical protein
MSQLRKSSQTPRRLSSFGFKKLQHAGVVAAIASLPHAKTHLQQPIDGRNRTILYDELLRTSTPLLAKTAKRCRILPRFCATALRADFGPHLGSSCISDETKELERVTKIACSSDCTPTLTRVECQ